MSGDLLHSRRCRIINPFKIPADPGFDQVLKNPRTLLSIPKVNHYLVNFPIICQVNIFISLINPVDDYGSDP